jgi:hypothetical protein
MSTHVSARFELSGWDETPYLEAEDGTRLVRATMRRTFSGGLEGEGAVEYLMAFRADGDAAYVGLERIDGTLDGRAGTFVLQHVGRFEGGAATGDVSVVPGSGSGELEGLAGEGRFAAEGGPTGTVELDLA